MVLPMLETAGPLLLVSENHGDFGKTKRRSQGGLYEVLPGSFVIYEGNSGPLEILSKGLVRKIQGKPTKIK